MAFNVPHFAMFGAGTILARSATPAPNMGGATERSVAAKCVLGAVNFYFSVSYSSILFNLNTNRTKSSAS